MEPIKICILTPTGELQHTIVFSEKGPTTGDAVYYTEEKIHPDDSIRTIKMKLLYELHEGPNANKIQLRPSYEELYLYGFAKEETTTLQLFDALKTEDETDPIIQRDLIHQMLEGHPSRKYILDSLPDKDAIPYSQFESVLSENKIGFAVKTPLGITFARGRRDVTFEADPFSVEKHRSYLEEHNGLHYFDDSLLLTHGTIIDNTIYVCLAEKVFESITLTTAEDYIARYYFPGLYKAGVKSKDELIAQRGKLVKSTQKLLTEERAQYYKSIATFYKIAADDAAKIQYVVQGIHKITLRLKNQESKRANLETLFKNMHCSREVPYIKFNPGNRRENLYRFYFERTTRTGKKIPYLSRSHIMRMTKETGRGQQISAYLEGAVKDVISNCYVHFESDGDIQIQLAFHSPIDERTLDETIRDKIMPYLLTIERDVRQTGFSVPSYFGLRNVANTKVVDMTFVSRFAATKIVSWESIPCIYSICTLSADAPGQARLKRVENFKEMDAAHILIAELYGQVQYGEMGLQDIVDELVSRRLSENEESARILIAGFLSSINEMNGEIVEKPGFPMDVNIDSDEKTVEIRISEISSIFYLDTIGVYLDAIAKTSQLYKESNPLLKELKKLCKKSAKFREVENEPEDVPKLPQEKDGGPLRLSKFAKEDDFFAQFESEEEDEEPVATKREDVTVREEEAEDTESLLDKLRKNTGNIPKPILFNDDESEEEKEPEPEPEPVRRFEKKKGPIVFSDGDESDEEEEVLVTKESPKEQEMLAPKEQEALKPGAPKEQQPLKKRPIMFDEDDDEETGGAKKVAFLDESNTDAENEDDAENTDYDDEDDDDNDDEADDEDEENEHKKRIGSEGKPLKSFLLKKLQKRDPVIFTSTKKNGIYRTFSTSCQPTTRHPVILTQDEFDKTDKSAYDHAIKYGSDPKKQHYFICPRFWCFLTNSAISEKDAKTGKCGKIIPKDAEVVPKGAYVYELNKDSKNQYPFPGFMENTRADGKCLPCCFKTWKGAKQVEARERCSAQMNIDENEEDTEQPAKTKKKRKTTKAAQYIISLDTYPVTEQRWGFLPIPVQLFLQIDYRPVLDPNNPALLKPGKEVLLRWGVERNQSQSFLGCFADIYAHRQGLNKVPSIDEFRQVLTEAINLDVFAKAHNGSLLSVFWKKRNPSITAESRQKYKNTEFALALNLTDKSNRRHLDDAIVAYENFIAYISDPTAKIDHQYLWDFVCDDNRRVIPKGVNLVILEIRANDIIDRIELVCPTNLYSRHQYDSAKDTVLLLKHDEFYEPIYIYESVASGEPKITRFLSQTKLPGTVADMLKRVEQATQKYCPGLPSLPKIYRFANPIPIRRLLGALVKIGAKIESQVVNYQGQTIGLMVLEKTAGDNKAGVYIPCAPSARLPQTPIKYMDSTSIPKDYQTTVETLRRISASTKIPCKPVWKIREDGLVVGFLTETNQFVPIQPNQDIIMDGLQTYEGVDVFAADKKVATESEGDKERIQMTKYITLESQFYHAFRNRVRTLFSEFLHRPLKTQIRKIADDKTLLYSQKIEQIEPLIKQLIKKKVVFIEIDDATLMDLAEVNECENAEDEGPYCIIKENGVAQLGIPKWNLISDYDNEKMYVGRMADELVRNDRVKSMMYDTANRLNSRTTDYKIKSDEFILVQSALTTEYFSELDSYRETTPYAEQTNYELANPSISVVYSNEKIPLSEQQSNADAFTNIPKKKERTPEKEPEPELTPEPSPGPSPEPVKDNDKDQDQDQDQDQECIVKISKIIGNKHQVWYRMFSEDAREYVFRDTATCTFQPIIRIVKSKLDENWTETDVQNKLAVAYARLFEINPLNMVKIAKIMRDQGKAKMFEKFVKTNSGVSPEAFRNIVISEGYFITDMDIWVLANEYNLPIVVFNARGLKGFFPKQSKGDGDNDDESDIHTHWINMGGDKGDKYHFIRSKIRVTKGGNHIYEYNLIVPDVKLSQVGEFEAMVVESVQYERLNTTPLEDALDKFFA